MKKPDPSGDLAVSLKMLDGITKIQPIPHKSNPQSKNTIEE